MESSESWEVEETEVLWDCREPVRELDRDVRDEPVTEEPVTDEPEQDETDALEGAYESPCE